MVSTRSMLSIFVLVAILPVSLILLFPVPAVAAAPILTENFANNSFNTSIWRTFDQGSGPQAIVASQRLEVTIPSNSLNDPSIGGFGAGLGSMCTVRGDFDMQVGFQLLVWPTESGVRVGIGPSVDGLGTGSSGTPYAVERDSFSIFDSRPGENYLTHMLDGVQGITPTTALTGMLRVTRVGSFGTGYYLNGSNWVQIHTGPVVTSDVGFGFAAWSENNLFSNQAEKVAFDNFTLTSGQLQCPQISLNPVSGQDGTLVTVKGSGFPLVQSPFPVSQSAEVSFDDNFLGIAPETGGSFSFSFDVPLSQPGPHLVKAVDFSTNTNASTVFQVTSQPGSLSVQLTVGSVYFPGDSAVAEVLVTSGGTPVTSSGVQVNLTLTRPDNSHVSLNATSIGNGLYRASYNLPKTALIGTYSLVATVQTSGSGNGAAIAVFEVKLPWLSSQGQTLAIAGLASVAGVAVGLVSWRKGYFKKL